MCVRVIQNNEMFKTSNGDLRDARNVAVVVTGSAPGHTTENWLTVPYAVDARNDGVYIVTLSVGTMADTVMLNSIASPPTGKSVFQAQHGYELPDFRDRIFLASCDGIRFVVSVEEVVNLPPFCFVVRLLICQQNYSKSSTMGAHFMKFDELGKVR